MLKYHNTRYHCNNAFWLVKYSGEDIVGRDGTDHRKRESNCLASGMESTAPYSCYHSPTSAYFL